jgi:nucleoside-diphosphate-sugar epimerase
MLAARCNELMCKVLRTKSEPRLLPVPVGVLSYSMTLSIHKAQQELGYDPPATLDDAIAEFSHWWLATRSE